MEERLSLYFVCPSIYGFRLLLGYFQTLLVDNNGIHFHWMPRNNSKTKFPFTQQNNFIYFLLRNNRDDNIVYTNVTLHSPLLYCS